MPFLNPVKCQHLSWSVKKREHQSVKVCFNFVSKYLYSMVYSANNCRLCLTISYTLWHFGKYGSCRCCINIRKLKFGSKCQREHFLLTLRANWGGSGPAQNTLKTWCKVEMRESLVTSTGSGIWLITASKANWWQQRIFSFHFSGDFSRIKVVCFCAFYGL